MCPAPRPPAHVPGGRPSLHEHPQAQQAHIHHVDRRSWIRDHHRTHRVGGPVPTRGLQSVPLTLRASHQHHSQTRPSPAGQSRSKPTR
eukprot:5300525-Prymnesium_polylepis.1